MNDANKKEQSVKRSFSLRIRGVSSSRTVAWDGSGLYYQVLPHNDGLRYCDVCQRRIAETTVPPNGELVRSGSGIPPWAEYEGGQTWLVVSPWAGGFDEALALVERVTGRKVTAFKDNLEDGWSSRA